MSFATAISCLDGRTQLPVNGFLQDRFGAAHIDTITESGPVHILAREPEAETARSIYQRVEISLNAHHSKGLAIVAHTDCAGNPVTNDYQQAELATAVKLLTGRYPGVAVIGLWVGEDWSATEIGARRQ